MSTELVVGILGVGGLSAIVAAVVTGLFSKKKLGAEATEIITKAAAGVVTSLQSDMARQREEHDRAMASQRFEHDRVLNRIREDHGREMAEVSRVLGLHVAWDAIAIAKLLELGVQLPPAPPLLSAPTQDVERRG